MDYPLKDFAHFTESYGERVGMVIHCPNCSAAGGVMFSGTEFRKRNPGATWERVGDTLDTISLTPSVKVIGHFHSMVTNGILHVDSPFECTKYDPN